MIRQATRYDIPRLMEFVEAYAKANPIRILADASNHDYQHVEQLLFEIISGRGFALIDHQMRGTLIAIKQRNIWCPNVIELHELLWWVDPEHRGILGGRLWAEFYNRAKKMKADAQVDVIYSSVNEGGPMIDYTKRGFKIMGATFFRE